MRTPSCRGRSSIRIPGKYRRSLSCTDRRTGKFSPAALSPGISVRPAVCGDVDGNGTADIVATGTDTTGATVVSVLLNDGKGNFKPSGATPYTGAYAGSFTLVDVDGDDKPDLLFSVEDALLYFRNLGAGTFAAPVTLTNVASDNRAFVVADFNEDGMPDIAYVAVNGGTAQDELHLLINKGNGSFVDEVAQGITGQIGSFGSADFNLDGHADLAIEQQSSLAGLSLVRVQTFLGQGNGSFSAGPQSVVEANAFQMFQFIVGDFDVDGFPDIAAENGDTEPGHVVLLWGDGSGGFSRQQVNGPQGFSLTWGDVNGDGIPDVIVPDRFGNISVLLGRSTRAFPSVASFTPATGTPLSAGDVFGNHEIDLLAPGTLTPFDQAGTVAGILYVNGGNGQFTVGGSSPAEGFALSDLNGDGLADLVGTDGTNLLIWPGTRDPSFQSSSPITIPPPAGSGFPNSGFISTELQIADMDGDGRPDIVMPNLILFNQGDFTFTAVPIPFGGTSGPFVVADFNHDGLLDIAMRNFTLLGQAGRTFRRVSPNGLNLTDGNFAATGDLNGDGYADIVFGGNSYPLIVEYGRGDGTFYTQTVLNIGPSDFSQSIAVADANGDGRPDIVACLFLSEQCVIYTNDGQGGFARSYFASGTTSMYLLAGDLKGNGTLGLAINNYVVDYRPPNFVVILEK
jgi:FG-GAP-like repeat